MALSYSFREKAFLALVRLSFGLDREVDLTLDCEFACSDKIAKQVKRTMAEIL